jgi:hypothetical protein
MPASDLGDRIGFVGSLQGARQQCLLADRLWRLARINAGRAEEQKLLDTRAMCRMDDIGLDEQVVVEKVGWKRIVGVDAAHAAGSEKDDPRPMRRHPLFDMGLAAEVDRLSAWIEQQLTGLAPEPAHHGASDHAMLTGDPDELICVS